MLTSLMLHQQHRGPVIAYIYIVWQHAHKSRTKVHQQFRRRMITGLRIHTVHDVSKK